jgi:hypothetical protein
MAMRRTEKTSRNIPMMRRMMLTMSRKCQASRFQPFSVAISQGARPDSVIQCPNTSAVAMMIMIAAEFCIASASTDRRSRGFVSR